MRATIRILALVALCAPASAHTEWSNGDPVPAWIRQACCGPADAHRLTMDQVHHSDDGWHVDGYPYPIPDREVLPSEDGRPWIFYRVLSNGDFSVPYCFFLPLTF